jgi:hypothetical protein
MRTEPSPRPDFDFGIAATTTAPEDTAASTEAEWPVTRDGMTPIDTSDPWDRFERDPHLDAISPSPEAPSQVAARALPGIAVHLPVNPVTQLERSPGFGELAPNIQQTMRARLIAAPALLLDFQKLAASPSFRSLPQDIQGLAIDQLAKHAPAAVVRGNVPDSFAASRARAIIVDLVTRPAFAGMNIPGEQGKLLRYIGGNNSGISSHARDELAKGLATLTPLELLGGRNAASEYLSRFLQRQSATPLHPMPSDFPGTTPPHPYAMSPATPFMADYGPATIRTVRMDHRNIRIVIPEPPPPGTPSQEALAAQLSRLPAPLRRQTTDVVLDPTGKPGQWGSNGGHGRINIYPDGWAPDRLENVLVHETSHLFSDANNGDYFAHDPRWNAWVDAITSDELFPSTYGKDSFRNSNDATEDYAEAMVVYLSVKGTPREAEMRAMMPARFAILDRQTSAATL